MTSGYRSDSLSCVLDDSGGCESCNVFTFVDSLDFSDKSCVNDFGPEAAFDDSCDDFEFVDPFDSSDRSCVNGFGPVAVVFFVFLRYRRFILFF